jgi:alpha-maltose-1-phosphate synthase
MSQEMRVLLLTNEYPPHIYGGAGVHVEYLARELATLACVEVRTFGTQEVQQEHLHVRGLRSENAAVAAAPPHLASPLQALNTCVTFTSYPIAADVVHCHTWYTHFGGIVAKILYGVPLVITVHSLEPLRPWKREQLGRGYDLSTWIEKTALEMADAIIAVSASTATEVTQLFAVDPATVTVIPNGIDTAEYAPVTDPDCLTAYGIDPAHPYVLFLGRMTQQKGLRYLLEAIPYLTPEVQVVLCAGAADTPEMAQEIEATVTRLQQQRSGIIWIPTMVPRRTSIALYSHAAVFCCPSIYEPFGLINLEAMACATPVVASAVGGIPEVVVDGETGYLVDPDLSSAPPYEPRDATQFAHRLAAALNRVLADPARRRRMGRQGRARVEQHYSWSAVAQQTLALYGRLLSPPP